jgi:hypothetical protein
VPYREAPELTVKTIAAFVNRLLQDHHEAVQPAQPGIAAS